MPFAFFYPQTLLGQRRRGDSDTLVLCRGWDRPRVRPVSKHLPVLCQGHPILGGVRY